MPEVSTYDPKKVTVSIGGRVITGFAADGVVTLTHNEDAVTPSVGAKGDVAYSENANNSGNAALPLMSTSSSLAYLREICAKRRPVRFSVSDVNDADAIQVSGDTDGKEKLAGKAEIIIRKGLPKVYGSSEKGNCQWNRIHPAERFPVVVLRD